MLIDIGTLSAQLGAISALSKVVTDVIVSTTKVKSGRVKQVASMLVSVGVALVSDVGVLTSTNPVYHYAGVVAAGLIAGLGSNVIHEAMTTLDAVKKISRSK